MAKVCHPVENFLKEWDGVTEPQCNAFKFKGDVKQKSVIGGVCYLIA